MTLKNGPKWISSERFDIEAKSAEQAQSDFWSLTESQRESYQKQTNERLRALMAQRFQLVAREDRKDMPVYALVVAKGGSKLKPTADASGMTGFTMKRSALEGKVSTNEKLD